MFRKSHHSSVRPESDIHAIVTVSSHTRHDNVKRLKHKGRTFAPDIRNQQKAEMKVVFVVQGEGRGHLTQAITMKELLCRNGHEVTKVLVGRSKSRCLPDFFRRSIGTEVKTFDSPNFMPKPDNKRSSVRHSLAYNIRMLPQYMKIVCFIADEIECSGADLVVNFYEILTGMAYLFLSPSVPYVCIGHQYLFLHEGFAFPKGRYISRMGLLFFTHLTSLRASRKLALSFREMPYDRTHDITVVPPLLRKEVKRLKVSDGDFVHGYMVNSGFGENILAWHKSHPHIPLRFFWDKKGEAVETVIDPTLRFHQIDDIAFLKQMADCKAYASTAGFESICEAMYLGKPILMVPAHIEQDCNAFDAVNNGAGIAADDFDIGRLIDFAGTYKPNKGFRQWANSSEFMFMPILLAASASRKRYGQRLYDRLLQPVVRYLLA